MGGWAAERSVGFAAGRLDGRTAGRLQMGIRFHLITWGICHLVVSTPLGLVLRSPLPPFRGEGIPEGGKEPGHVTQLRPAKKAAGIQQTNKQRIQGNTCVGARRRFAKGNLQHVPSDARMLEDGRLFLSPSIPYVFRNCQFRYLEAVVSRREYCVRYLASQGLKKVHRV